MNSLDADALIKAKREVKPPFRLVVKKADGGQLDLTVTRVLRLLPGKRIAAVANSESGNFLIKLFIGRFARRYWRRELKGVQAIESAGVLTPKVLWQGDLASGGGCVLAFEYIEDTQDLMAQWGGPGSETLTPIGLEVTGVLSRLHESGVIQNDIHPGNFMIRNKSVYTIDGGDVIRKVSGPLSEPQSLENLSLFFAQFHADQDGMIPAALAEYCRRRGWSPDTSRLPKVIRLVENHRDSRKREYIEKAFRECTRFSCTQSFTRFEVCERKYDSGEMRTLLGQLDAAIAKGVILKNGNSATVALIDGPGGQLVVKRYNIKGMAHRLSRLFVKSRAWNSWANAYRLEFLGIRTVTPVAMIEQRIGPLRGKAYFVSEYVQGPDATTLCERSVEPGDAQSKIESIAALLKRLAVAGLTHGDLKASNFLLPPDGATLIDLDSMTDHDSMASFKPAMVRDLVRFQKNWADNPAIAEKFRRLTDDIVTSQIN